MVVNKIMMWVFDGCIAHKGTTILFMISCSRCSICVVQLLVAAPARLLPKAPGGAAGRHTLSVVAGYLIQESYIWAVDVMVQKLLHT